MHVCTLTKLNLIKSKPTLTLNAHQDSSETNPADTFKKTSGKSSQKILEQVIRTAMFFYLTINLIEMSLRHICIMMIAKKKKLPALKLKGKNNL